VCIYFSAPFCIHCPWQTFNICADCAHRHATNRWTS
jgi:hypothetical protein